MPFVSVPRDLTKIKTKLLLNLTRRQLICFGAAAVVGVPTYFLTKDFIGNSAAVLLMIGLMPPAFFIAMYERDGRPAERILRDIIRLRLFYPSKRPYRTENFYQIIEREAQIFEECTAGKPPDASPAKGKRKGTRPTGRGKDKSGYP